MKNGDRIQITNGEYRGYAGSLSDTYRNVIAIVKLDKFDSSVTTRISYIRLDR